MTAMIQNAPDFTRSMIEPETIEAVVQENSRNAPKKTPLRRAQVNVSVGVRLGSTGLPPMCAPISSFHGSAKWAVTSPPVMPGPFTMEE
jgi:hypothetical protein